MRRLPLLAAVAVASGGCVERIAASRIRTALTDAGIAEATAECMAGRMVDRLTIGQLRKLEKLRRARHSLPGYLEAVSKVGDPEVLAVTASSAALCSTGLAR